MKQSMAWMQTAATPQVLHMLLLMLVTTLVLHPYRRLQSELQRRVLWA